MPQHAPILTRRRLLVGGMAAGIVALAIALLRPDARQGLIGASPFGEPVDRDLDAIRKDTLRVLVIEHHLVYSRANGTESGLEYELLERVARDIGVPIKAVVVARPDSLLPLLQRGIGDVIAAHVGQRNPIDHWIIHTVPYRYVSPVFITLRPDPLLGVNADGPKEPDTAWVSVWSPFAPRAKRFPGNDGEADLSKPALHYYFPTREDLVGYHRRVLARSGVPPSQIAAIGIMLSMVCAVVPTSGPLLDLDQEGTTAFRPWTMGNPGHSGARRATDPVRNDKSLGSLRGPVLRCSSCAPPGT